MAVYTKINKKDISYINSKFDIEEFISFQGIKQGIENTNYLLKSKKNKFTITIDEVEIIKEDVVFKIPKKLN